MGACCVFFFFFQAEDGILDFTVTGVQTCALPISESKNNNNTIIIKPASRFHHMDLFVMNSNIGYMNFKISKFSRMSEGQMTPSEAPLEDCSKTKFLLKTFFYKLCIKFFQAPPHRFYLLRYNACFTLTRYRIYFKHVRLA